MNTFKDHFSQQSAIYARYRPDYPSALFDFIAGSVPGKRLAWDCGTGNGQAAKNLAVHFEKVHAADPSADQIKNSVPDKKITYVVEPAEKCSLPDHSADVITVANALHWFDSDLFYREVRRVLKPEGMIFAWAYALPAIDKETDRIISRLHDEILGDFWLPENKLVEQEYTTIDFPFQKITAPLFYSEKFFSLNDLLGYLHTWSAVQRFIKEQKTDPLLLIRNDLMRTWNGGEERRVRWRLFTLAGRL
jgi:ubiquinone/menaquinone biosynthesis C-methylase UbiE